MLLGICPLPWGFFKQLYIQTWGGGCKQSVLWGFELREFLEDRGGVRLCTWQKQGIKSNAESAEFCVSFQIHQKSWIKVRIRQ